MQRKDMKSKTKGEQKLGLSSVDKIRLLDSRQKSAVKRGYTDF